MTPLDARQHGRAGPSFSPRARVRRLWWLACWLLLARWTPPPCHPWRRWLLRRFGATVGARVRVHASARIWYPANLALGDDVLIGPGVECYNQGRIAIGARTVVSQRAHLCASSHALASPAFQLVLRPIRIGANAWIAAEAFVGPGAEVGDGAVLAARAALWGRAEPWQVYRGNPAVRLKPRSWPGD